MTDNGEKNRADSFAADSFVSYEATAEERTDKATDGDKTACPASDAGADLTDATGAADDKATADGRSDGSEAGFFGDASAEGAPGVAAQTPAGNAGGAAAKSAASGTTISGAEIYRGGVGYSNGLGIAAVICAALKLTILPFLPGLGIFAIIASGIQAARKRAFDWWSAIGLGLGIASVLVTIAMIITFIVIAVNAVSAGGVI